MRAISSARLERAAHNEVSPTATHKSCLLPSDLMSNRFVLGSNPRWPIKPVGMKTTSSALRGSGTALDVSSPLVKAYTQELHPTKARVDQSLGRLNNTGLRESRLVWSILGALGASDGSSNLPSPTRASIPSSLLAISKYEVGLSYCLPTFNPC